LSKHIIHLYLTSRKYLPTLFAEGLDKTRRVVPSSSPYGANAKSKSIKPRRKSNSARTLIP